MSYQNSPLSTTPRMIGSTVRNGIQSLGFWAAVLIPFTYLPVLSGMIGESSPETFAGLFVLNILCLLIGQGYDP